MRERVLITGGASGIGAAIAERCLEDGYEPIIIDISGSDVIANLSNSEETTLALKKHYLKAPLRA